MIDIFYGKINFPMLNFSINRLSELSYFLFDIGCFHLICLSPFGGPPASGNAVITLPVAG